MGELLVLRLQASISYLRSKDDIPPDSVEWIEIHRFISVFDFSSPDGPTASLPGPSSLVDSGYLAQGKTETIPPLPSFALEAGSYLFRQETEGPGFDLLHALREYIRDAWWEGRKPKEKLILRHILEDGKQSVQLLCPL